MLATRARTAAVHAVEIKGFSGVCGHVWLAISRRCAPWGAQFARPRHQTTSMASGGGGSGLPALLALSQAGGALRPMPARTPAGLGGSAGEGGGWLAAASQPPSSAPSSVGVAAAGAAAGGGAGGAARPMTSHSSWLGSGLGLGLGLGLG